MEQACDGDELEAGELQPCIAACACKVAEERAPLGQRDPNTAHRHQQKSIIKQESPDLGPR